MKKKIEICVVALLLVVSFNMNAQITINVDSINGALVSGTELNYTFDGHKNTYALPHLFVKNTGSTEKLLMVTRKIVEEPTDWQNYLCWGTLCYTPSPAIVFETAEDTVKAGEYQYISPYVQPKSTGNATYMFYVSEDGINYLDSVTVNFAFDYIPDGIASEIEGFNFYPNPAQNKVYIENTENSNLNLSIFSSVGELVLNKNFTTTNVLDISDLESGSYFISINNINTNAILNKKLTVIH